MRLSTMTGTDWADARLGHASGAESPRAREFAVAGDSAPGIIKRRAPSAERRAPSAERRAPSAERRAPSAERRPSELCTLVPARSGRNLPLARTSAAPSPAVAPLARHAPPMRSRSIPFVSAGFWDSPAPPWRSALVGAPCRCLLRRRLPNTLELSFGDAPPAMPTNGAWRVTLVRSNFSGGRYQCCD